VTTEHERPLIYIISDGSLSDENFPRKIEKFLLLIETATAARIPLVQIREKNISARLLYELTESVMTRTRSSKTKVLVNDRVDVALAAKADGVHLTSTSISPDIVRGSVPNGFLIGVSTHSADEIDAARNRRANFAIFGPVFDTPGKGEPIGLKRFHNAAANRYGFPVIAVGGIDLTNYHDVVAAGAAGFAAIRFLNDPQNLEKLSLEFGP
jgi:thiamine-phosphate pyrophosphorylase